MVSVGKKVGSTLILTGTIIGAGMLAQPMASAAGGLIPALLLVVAMWALMCYTGLLVLEVNLSLPLFQNSFNSMAKSTLGRPGEITAWVTCMLLLYALIAAYIAGDSSVLSQLVQTYTQFKISNQTNAIIFTLIFGSAVFWGTHTVDLVNRLLMSMKGILVICMLAFLFPHINFIALSQGHPHILLAAIPVFFTAFGYHTVIPSITNYIGKEPKILRWIIWIGTAFPLVIYLLWLTCTLTIIPAIGPVSFTTLAQHGSSVGEFIAAISAIIQNKTVTFIVNCFANVAMTTSFLGVSLGLFDFLADAFKRKNHYSGRFQTAMLTFTPPLLFALFYPKGFIVALGYAGLCLTIIAVILPALMVYRLRQRREVQLYQVWGGRTLLVIIFVTGVGLLFFCR